MSALIPTIDSATGIREVGLVGFADEEPWGRWTLGKQSSITFTLDKPTTLNVEFYGYMAQHNQQLFVVLDKIPVASFTFGNNSGNMQFGKSISVMLLAGRHRLLFHPTVSSRSMIQVSFAPEDPRNLGVALQSLTFSPNATALPYAPLPLDLLRSQKVQRTGSYLLHRRGPYVIVAPEGLTASFTTSGQAVVKYSFVRSRHDQQFRFFVDNQAFYQTRAPGVARVVRGQIIVPELGTGIHRLIVESVGSGTVWNADHLLVDTAISSKSTGFYVDQLLLIPRGNFTAFLLTITLLSIVGILLLFRLFFSASLHERNKKTK